MVTQVNYGCGHTIDGCLAHKGWWCCSLQNTPSYLWWESGPPLFLSPGDLPSIQQTASKHLKMDGTGRWSFPFWGPPGATWHSARGVSFRDPGPWFHHIGTQHETWPQVWVQELTVGGPHSGFGGGVHSIESSLMQGYATLIYQDISC